MNLEDSHRQSLNRLPMLAGLAADDRNRLIDASRLKPYRRGEVLFLQGDAADRLFVLLSGWVVIYRLTAEGGRTVLHVIKPGENFAEPAALGLGKFPANGEAAADSIIAEIPADLFKDIIRSNPDAALNVIAALSKRLRGVVDDMERRQFYSTTERLAGFLSELTSETSGTVEIVLPYDKALAAARLGMTPESFSRALKKLQPDGVETDGNGVKIRDIAKLRALVEP